MPRAPRRSPEPNGRPAFAPTKAQRDLVKMLRGGGTVPEVIARLVGVSLPTLRKHFADEMAHGKAEVVARIAGKCISKALAGDNSMIALYLKTHGGPEWQDRHKVEHTGANGGAIQVESVRERIESRIVRLAAAGGKVVDP